MELGNTRLFEVAWEVCNQVGGIYTVIRSKVPQMTLQWGSDYCAVGPYTPNNTEFEEGCLSLPDQYANVTRPYFVVVKYRDIKGKLHKNKFEGLEGTCIQHEIDHLNGKLFVDHISKLRKQIIFKKLKKLKKLKSRI